MELSWLMKIRITAAVAVGVFLIGIFAWPLAKPSEPFESVSLLNGSVGFTDALKLIVLAVVTGLAAYFVSWPFGRQLGILAVPAGLIIWAVRSGNITSLLRLNPTLSERVHLASMLKWEPFFWLAVVAAGFAGVIFGQFISRPQIVESYREFWQTPRLKKTDKFLNPLIAMVLSVFVTQLCIGIFARDVTIPDARLGEVVAQPVVGQIAFAVMVSFAIAAFLVKKFLRLSYIWPIIASALVTAFVSIFYINTPAIQYVVEHYPATLFLRSICTVLPLQMVAFGSLGSVIGFWMAVRWEYWRKHEVI